LTEYITSLFIVILIVLISCILRLIHRTWLAPSAFYSLWWGSTTLVSLIIGRNEIIPFWGLIWLLISCLIVGAGSLVFYSPKHSLVYLHKLNFDTIEINNNFFKLSYYFSLFISFFYIISSLIYNDISLADFKSLEGLLALSVKFSVDRYEENVILPIYIKLQLPFVFLSNALGGTLFSITRKKRYLICLLPPVIIAILFTEKAGIFFCLSIWMACLLSLNVFFGRFNIFNFKNILKIGLSLALLLFLMFISAFARLGTIDFDEFEVVLEKLYSTLFGHIAAFSFWFSNFDLFSYPLQGGKYTFSGVFDFFGLSKRQSGLYIENYQLSNGAMTNLYSIHKGLLLDYSIFGTLFIYFIFGVVGSYFFQKVLSGNQKYIGLLSIVYIIIFVSIYYSIFIFNTTLLACLMIVFIFVKLKFKVGV
jgi:oligosaccharide repeat unit polymerase